MKNLILVSLIVFISSFAISNDQIQPIYQFNVNDIDGGEFKFEELKGKKVMIVNTASKCGFTDQFGDLQKLYEKYKDDNFVIIGFPSNDFLNQDPGTNEEIAEFCRVNYGVTFPMMAKIEVVGDDMHPVYKYLTSQELNGTLSSKVKWNFQKYLINEEGFLVDVVGTRTSPLADEIIEWIEGR